MLAEMQGGNGVLRNSWVGNDPCGDAWVGVTCAMGREQMQVVGLDLSFQGLRGLLPETLSAIELLTSVSFSANK